jgi:phytoene dehydrogenase-like protein
MEQNSIIIIGAGIAGLAAGCYAAMNGYFTQIFELHGLPGGLCTSWKRRGYTVDSGMRFVGGVNPHSSINQVWRELGVAQNREFLIPEYSSAFIDRDGAQLIFYSDPDRLEEHLKTISPQDAPVIDDFTAAVRDLTSYSPSLDSSDGLFKSIQRSIQAYPRMKTIRKWASVPISEFARRFNHPFLQKAFELLLEGMPDTPVLSLISSQSLLAAGNAGYPLGGALELARAVENRFLALGGNIHYFSRVVKVLVEDGIAVGVELDNGDHFYADLVISAADGHGTIFDLLDGRYLDSLIQDRYEHLPLYRPIVQVSFGINRDLKGAPHSAAYVLPDSIEIAGESRRSLSFWHTGEDPTAAPSGKAVITSQIYTDYGFWKRISADPASYASEKEKIAAIVLEQLNHFYPDLYRDVEMKNVATPTTTERYTANWQGAIQGWAVSPPGVDLLLRGGVRKTLPGLRNFYMVGQWVEPGGGLLAAALSARSLVQRLCMDYRQEFLTTEAARIQAAPVVYGPM